LHLSGYSLIFNGFKWVLPCHLNVNNGCVIVAFSGGDVNIIFLFANTVVVLMLWWVLNSFITNVIPLETK